MINNNNISSPSRISRNDKYSSQEANAATKRIESTLCQSILSEMTHENDNTNLNKLKVTREKPDGLNNVFEQINKFCKEFGPEEISACLGELGVSIEDLARKGGKLSPEQVDTLYSLLSNQKTKEFTWKDPSLKKAGQVWYKNIQLGHIPPKKSMLAYFEREAYHAFKKERYHLKPFLEDIRNKYGEDAARTAGCVLEPDALSRLCMGYEITAPEMEKVLKVANLVFPPQNTRSMTLTKKHYSKPISGRSHSNCVSKSSQRYRDRQLRLKIHKQWHNDIEQSVDDYSTQPFLLINGMTEKEWDDYQDRKESIIESYNENRDDDEPNGCSLS